MALKEQFKGFVVQFSSNSNYFVLRFQNIYLFRDDLGHLGTSFIIDTVRREISFIRQTSPSPCSESMIISTNTFRVGIHLVWLFDANLAVFFQSSL